MGQQLSRRKRLGGDSNRKYVEPVSDHQRIGTFLDAVDRAAGLDLEDPVELAAALDENFDVELKQNIKQLVADPLRAARDSFIITSAIAAAMMIKNQTPVYCEELERERLPTRRTVVGLYHFKFDDRCRTIRAEGPAKNVPENQRDRKDAQQQRMRAEYLATDKQRRDYVAGHLIANEFGGSGYIENLVPLLKSLNNGRWRAMERIIVKLLDGVEATMVATVHWKNPAGFRRDIPTSITIDLRLRKAGQGHTGKRWVFGDN